VVRRKGAIVSIASVAGIMGNRGQANYAAAKAGLIGASRSVAAEVARLGIRVNVVAPGLIQTAMIRDAPVQHIKSLIPMARVGTPRRSPGWCGSSAPRMPATSPAKSSQSTAGCSSGTVLNLKLIYPRWPKLMRQTEFHLPPHGPVVMAAALPPDVAVTFVDENVQELDLDDRPTRWPYP